MALTGRAMRWPRLPVSVLAGVVAVDYQPRLRQLLEDRIDALLPTFPLALALISL